MISRLFQPPKHDRWDDYFEPGEVLLWHGQPAPGIKNVPGTLFMSIFGIPFFAGGVTVATGAVASLASGDTGIIIGIVALAFSVPFLSVGFGLTIGSWLTAIYGHRFTRYALTNKRAYVANSFFRHRLKSYVIGPDDIVTLTQGRHDDIKFKTIHERDRDGDRTTKAIGFDGITDGREVYALIRKIQTDTQ